jgi:hypothetical protein
MQDPTVGTDFSTERRFHTDPYEPELRSLPEGQRDE